MIDLLGMVPKECVAMLGFIAPPQRASPFLYDEARDSVEMLEVTGNEFFVLLQGY